MSRSNHHPEAERGSAFLLITILSISAVGIIGAFMMSSLDKVRHTKLELARQSAFNAAESGLNLAVERAWFLYRSTGPTDRVTTIGTLLDDDARLARVEVVGMPFGRSMVDVTVADVSQSGTS